MTALRRRCAASTAAAMLLAAGAASAAPLQTLFAFDGTQGFAPRSPPVSDANGNLFGTTTSGGSADRGVVFELSPPQSSGGAWTYSIAHNFGGAGDGDDSLGGLAIGSHGTLYGTTYMGGAADQGTVFELTPPTPPGKT
jgi:uncharacterized repeat protein (TIGR03803 family)